MPDCSTSRVSAIEPSLSFGVGRTRIHPATESRGTSGQQPRCMSLLWFQRNALPTDWVAQREVVAGFDA